MRYRKAIVAVLARRWLAVVQSGYTLCEQALLHRQQFLLCHVIVMQFRCFAVSILAIRVRMESKGIRRAPTDLTICL